MPRLTSVFLASYPESRICRGIRFTFSMIYVRQSSDNSKGGCSPRHRLRPSDFVSALMDVRRKRAAAGTPVWSTQHRGVPIYSKRVCPRRLISTSWGRPFRQTKNCERICVRRTPPRNCSNVVVHKNQVKRIPLTNSAISSKIARNIDVSRGII